MRKLITCLVVGFLLVGASPALAASTCYSQSECPSGYQCVYLNNAETTVSGYCAQIYQRPTVTPTAVPTKTTVNCGWCGTSCVNLNKITGACAQIYVMGKTCVNNNGSCVILTVVPTKVVPTKAVPTIACKNLWWFNDSSKVCAQQKFCGAYMYQGLQTFSTQTECQKNLPKTNCALKKCGDANCDGRISSMDMLIWVGEKGGTGRSADFNGDGKVDISDYDLLRNGMVNGCKVVPTLTPTLHVVLSTPTPVKFCNVDKDCLTGQVCYQPPMPVCPTGTVCMQVLPAKYCKTLGVVTSMPASGCNIKGTGGKVCPSGLVCVQQQGMTGDDGICVKSVTTPTPKVCQFTGDADGDGRATLKDFAIWKYEYSIGKAIKADFNCDKIVDLNDYVIWRKAFLLTKDLMVTTNN